MEGDDTWRMIPVQSSTISAIGYDSKAQQMDVRFRGGGVYTHHGVSPDDHIKFMNAPSMGRHYHDHFKGRFGVKKAG